MLVLSHKKTVNNLLIALAVLPSLSSAQEKLDNSLENFVEVQAELSETVNYYDIHHPVIGRKGMVVSQSELASNIGAGILEKGGNAVDAAVAVGFALAVALPRAGNLAGGGFMLVHLAKQQKTIAINYREEAPQAAHRDLFLDNQGQVDTDKSLQSLASSGIPGTVAGLT